MLIIQQFTTYKQPPVGGCFHVSAYFPMYRSAADSTLMQNTISYVIGFSEGVSGIILHFNQNSYSKTNHLH